MVGESKTREDRFKVRGRYLKGPKGATFSHRGWRVDEYVARGNIEVDTVMKCEKH